MSRMLLVQLDGSLPNLALMRIAAHCRERGDEVDFLRVADPAGVQPELWGEPERVYASLIFGRSRPLAEHLLRVYPDAVIGGTGWSLAMTLERAGVWTADLDYSIYPEFSHSIGFTQRGCRFHCPFCVVPGKEGPVRETATIAEVWRGDPYPRNLILLDNDFFGQPSWRDRVAEIQGGGFKVNFNQGINARTLNSETATALAEIRCYDARFRRRRIYTAWDNRKDERRVMRGLRLLLDRGVKPDQIMVYMLIGFWPGETVNDWDYRRVRLRALGVRPYPMTYERTRETVGFQRWVVGAYDKRIPWKDWVEADYLPRRLGACTA